MKIDGFLNVPDIPGPSQRSGHEDEMEVHGLEFSMEAPHDPNSLSRRGRVSLSTVTFVKHYDMGSPYLKQACFQNKIFPEVTFTARRTIEGEDSDYLIVKLENSSVISYAVKPSQEDPDVLEERVAFAFSKIVFTYDDSHEIEMDVHVGR